MTDITPGFTFSPGQLVSANNLNKVVGDAIINDETITATKLSEDSVEGAVMGHSTMQRADVSDQDFFLIYDVSESKLKKLPKLDLVANLNVVFEGGVSSGTSGNATTIDGSTGAIVMQSGNLTMNSGNLETNDAHIKGDLQVDGSLTGNIAYTGNVSFGTAGTGVSTFSNTDGSLTMDEGIESKFLKLTGFDPNSPTNSSGAYTSKIGLNVDEDIACGGAMLCSGIIGNGNFYNIGQTTFLQANDANSSHMFNWGFTPTSGGLSVANMPAITNRSSSHATNQGLMFFMMSSDTSKNIDWSFRGDIMWLYPEDRQVDQATYLQLTAKDSSDQNHSWYIRSFYPLSSGTKVLEILPSTYTGGTQKVNIGSSSSNASLDVFGNFAITGTKNFRICHPILEGKDLQHCAIEAPKGDLIYRGKYTLGTDPVNLDENANMTEGTFVKLVRDVQVFVQNNAGWDRVKGRVEGNKLYIDCENSDCTDEVDWLVIGERKDADYINGDNTDDDGNFITELDCEECLPDCDDCPPSDLPTEDTIVLPK